MKHICARLVILISCLYDFCFARHPGRPRIGVLVGIVLASVLGTWALLAVLVWWDLVRRRTILTRVLTARTSLRSEDHWSPSKDALSINVAMFQKFLPKLTLSDLVDATRNFAIENVIGDGGFGTVYKATFQVRFLLDTIFPVHKSLIIDALVYFPHRSS